MDVEAIFGTKAGIMQFFLLLESLKVTFMNNIIRIKKKVRLRKINCVCCCKAPVWVQMRLLPVPSDKCLCRVYTCVLKDVTVSCELKHFSLRYIDEKVC